MKILRNISLAVFAIFAFSAVPAVAAAPESVPTPIVVGAELEPDGQSVAIKMYINDSVFETKTPDRDYIAINPYWRGGEEWVDCQIYQLWELARDGEYYVLACKLKDGGGPDEVKVRLCYVTSGLSGFSVLRYYDFSNTEKVDGDGGKGAAGSVPTTLEFHNASDWAASDLATAAMLDLVVTSAAGDLRKNITREEFAEVALAAYYLMTGDPGQWAPSPFSDCDNPYVAMSAQLGIVTGIGNNLFSPGGNITREQMTAMICRMVKAAKPRAVLDAPQIKGYSDAAGISAYADESMRAMVSCGVIVGSGGKLNPQGSATREQAIIMVLRAYNCFNGHP